MPPESERLSTLGGRVQEQSHQFAEVANMFRHLDGKIDVKIDGLRAEMTNQFRWTVGIMLTLAGLFAAFGHH
jgi:hypothetical protein